MTHIIIDEKTKQGSTLLAYLKEIGRKEKYVKILSEEEKEELALIQSIEEGMKTKTISKAEIMKTLKAQKK